MKRGYKFCGYQGCRRLVKDSRHTYCPDCARKEADRRRKAMARSLQSYGRRWRNLRNAYLAANPFCERCGALGEEVDHLQPHRGERHLLLDSDNLWSLCRRCHREITQWELTCGLADPLMPDAKKKKRLLGSRRLEIWLTDCGFSLLAKRLPYRSQIKSALTSAKVFIL